MILFVDIETISDSENVLRHDMSKMQDKYSDKIDFMPEFNEILTITVGTVTIEEGSVIKNLEGDETEQIKAFFKAIEGNKICGFNIKGFDLPFIIKRALFHGINIPKDLRVFGKKPRELENIVDLMDIYRVMGRDTASLDVVCNFLGITSPKDGGIDGSMVQEFYDDGKIDEILEYCKRDVQATIDLFNYFKLKDLI